MSNKVINYSKHDWVNGGKQVTSMDVSTEKSFYTITGSRDQVMEEERKLLVLAAENGHHVQQSRGRTDWGAPERLAEEAALLGKWGVAYSARQYDDGYYNGTITTFEHQENGLRSEYDGCLTVGEQHNKGMRDTLRKVGLTDEQIDYVRDNCGGEIAFCIIQSDLHYKRADISTLIAQEGRPLQPTASQVKVSDENKLADGVYMVEGGAAVRVDPAIAQELLSDVARKHADKTQEGYVFSEQDGRDSIVYLELGQKGYIPMLLKNLYDHMYRLLRLLPDYLRERGILPQRDTETFEERLKRDSQSYLDRMLRASKSDILQNIQKIAAIERMSKLATVPESLSHIGLLLSQGNLAEKLYDALPDSTAPVTMEAMAVASEKITQAVGKEDMAATLDPFRDELEVARKVSIGSVAFEMKTPQNQERHTLNLKDFYRCLDAEMLDRFAAVEMQDFPVKDYYGDDSVDLFEELREKRFCANLEKNFLDYTHDRGNGCSFTILHTSKETLPENELTGIRTRHHVMQYARAAFVNPQPTIDRIVDYYGHHRDAIESAHELLQYASQPQPQQDNYPDDEEEMEL